MPPGSTEIAPPPERAADEWAKSPTASVPALTVVPPGIGIVGGQNRCSGADLRHRTGAGDHACEGHYVTAVEGERGPSVIDDAADDAAGRAAVAEL